MIFYTDDEYYKQYKKIMRLKSLTDAEKILLTIVASYNKTDKGLCMDNRSLSKETAWSVKKIQRTIDSLLKKKQIVIKRNKLHSPERYIFIYTEAIVKRYKQGFFGDKYILDFCE